MIMQYNWQITQWKIGGKKTTYDKMSPQYCIVLHSTILHICYKAHKTQGIVECMYEWVACERGWMNSYECTSHLYTMIQRDKLQQQPGIALMINK